MKTKDFDPNEEFAYREKHCKDKCRFSIAHLPIKRPPAYKRRIAELYALYKYYPVSVGTVQGFPELGPCINFVRFTRTYLGQYEKLYSPREREFFQKMINEKAPKRDELWPKI